MPRLDTETLSRLVTDATTRGTRPVPRIVVAVADREGVVFEKASGVKVLDEGRGQTSAADVAEDNRVQMDSIFWFASQTKLITSLATAILMERGVFHLDTLAEDFVPELKSIKILESYDDHGKPVLREPKTRITVRHLLTHTAGTRFTSTSPILERWRKDHGLETVWAGPRAPRETVAGLPLVYEPGERFSYAHDNDWLVFVCEEASGMDFEAFCQENIFGPLGISDMVWRREPWHEARQVNLCFRKPDETGFVGQPLGVVVKPEACSGGGGLFGSAVSYTKVLRTLLNDGVCPDSGVRIVGQATVKMMTTPLVTDPKYFEAVWEYMKHDTAVGPPGDAVDSSRQVCMIVKLVTKDIEGARRKGTFYGEGYANTSWMVDPTTGICMTVLTDVAPWGDPGVVSFIDTFERELYRQLGHAKRALVV